jgi:hypothetical protein
MVLALYSARTADDEKFFFLTGATRGVNPRESSVQCALHEALTKSIVNRTIGFQLDSIVSSGTRRWDPHAPSGNSLDDWCPEKQQRLTIRSEAAGKGLSH